MSSVLCVPLGVVIAREKIAHPWQSHRWRPVSVFLNAPEITKWRELRRDSETVLYHAATLPLELHRKETTAYRCNLANGEPSIYVVLRDDPDDNSDDPIEVQMVTASPFEAQSHGDVGLDHVEGVTMPEPLVEIVQGFIDLHHSEEKFVKRKRKPHLQVEDRQFGKDPIFPIGSADRIDPSMPQVGGEIPQGPRRGKQE